MEAGAEEEMDLNLREGGRKELQLPSSLDVLAGTCSLTHVQSPQKMIAGDTQ